MPNPVLVEVMRGGLVESIHRGAIVVTGVDGTPLLSVGDTARPVFARSAIKLLQAIPLITTGAADRYDLGDEAIALACGSHVGGDRHVGVARTTLAKLELGELCLACGPAEPQGVKARVELGVRGQRPTAFHHTCSGKHAGMLAATLAMDAPVETYTQVDHPVQKEVHAALAALTGLQLAPSACGTDGCGVPTWAMPLETLARLFAKIATGTGTAPTMTSAMKRIVRACWKHPELVAGPGRADTIVMAAFPERVYLKTGAEGIYCGALTKAGLGFALKMDDGATRASAAAVMPLLERLVPQARGLVKRSVLKAPDGRQAGTIRTSAEYERTLDRVFAVG